MSKGGHMRDAIVYTDGACSGNPGIGGWAYIIICDGKVISDCGRSKYDTTGNTMELKSVYRALKKCMELEVDRIRLYSDSAYVINNINNNAIFNWRANDWRKVNGRSIKNKVYWRKIVSILMSGKVKIIEFEKIKAHSGNKYNEKVDILAKGEIRKYVCSRKNS